MKKQNYHSAEQIIRLVPDELLDRLSATSNVDHFVKKLQGKTVFKLFLYGILSGHEISLRILETIFNSDKFKSLFNLPDGKIRHSGIAIRLSRISSDYFKNIFNHLVASPDLNEIIFAGKKILTSKIDSTLVLLSSKLLGIGMNDNHGKKTLKFSVELNGGIPVNIMLFRDQSYLSEENALPEIIKKKTIKNLLNIAIFDRGVQSKSSFAEFNKLGIKFITRIGTHKFDVVGQLPIEKKETETLRIDSYQEIKFSGKSNSEKANNIVFRLVTGRNKKTGETIKFITNVGFLSAAEITDLYRSRWEIETFFKFIKQEMNFSHLLSRNENGIKVVMYLTMIVAILLTVYKKMNKIIGWTVAKIKFLNELEINMMNNWHEQMNPLFADKNACFSGNLSGS